MTTHPPRFAILALATWLALGGCSAANPAADRPEAVVAIEWAEHLCHGRYTDAHNLVVEQARIDPSSPQVANPGLMLADQLAAEELEQLESAGTETSAEIEVGDVMAGTGSDPSSVTLSGSCWGEPFSHTVEVVEGDDGWQVATALPLWPTPVLFDYPGHNAVAHLTFERGVALGSSSRDGDRWLLLPGRHNVTVPPHFLTGEAVQSEITVNPFRIVEQGSLPAISTDQIDAAFTDFVATCGDLCLVTSGGESAASDSPGEQPVPLTPVTVEPVTGSEAHLTADAMLIRPTGAVPGFSDARPESWGQDSPDTGVAQLGNVALERTYLGCAADATPCTIAIDEELDAMDTVHALLFVDTGEEVAVSGLI